MMASLLFLILVICVFSFFFLFTLAKGLLVLLIFSKNQLWVFSFFSIVFPVFNLDGFCYNFNYFISTCCFRLILHFSLVAV